MALTHSLAISLGPDVRVNCISPGWIDVSGWKKRSARSPEEVAAAGLFLCSEEAGFITGENLVLDGE